MDLLRLYALGFFLALSEFRFEFGNQISKIVERYQLPIDEEIAAILPTSLESPIIVTGKLEMLDSSALAIIRPHQKIAFDALLEVDDPEWNFKFWHLVMANEFRQKWSQDDLLKLNRRQVIVKGEVLTDALVQVNSLRVAS